MRRAPRRTELGRRRRTCVRRTCRFEPLGLLISGLVHVANACRARVRRPKGAQSFATATGFVVVGGDRRLRATCSRDVTLTCTSPVPWCVPRPASRVLVAFLGPGQIPRPPHSAERRERRLVVGVVPDGHERAWRVLGPA